MYARMRCITHDLMFLTMECNWSCYLGYFYNVKTVGLH